VRAFRLEGVAPSIAQRKSLLEELLASFGPVSTFDEAPSRSLWRAIRDVTPFAAKGPRGDTDIWRMSIAPVHGAEVGRALTDKAGAETLYDWAGGLVWAAMPRSDDAHAALVHATVAGGGRAVPPPLARAPRGATDRVVTPP